jgi:hypothetical protein
MAFGQGLSGDPSNCNPRDPARNGNRAANMSHIEIGSDKRISQHLFDLRRNTSFVCKMQFRLRWN